STVAPRHPRTSHLYSSPAPLLLLALSYLFFFNDPATTEIYTLSLHDALPICLVAFLEQARAAGQRITPTTLVGRALARVVGVMRSEEHTSELQSLTNLVCRLLLEKKKQHSDHPKTRNTLKQTRRTHPIRRPPD